MSGTHEVMFKPEESCVCAVSKDLITQSNLSESYISDGCESEPRFKHAVEEFFDMNYSACGIDSCEPLAEKNSIQSIKQEYLSGQSDTSLDDSNSASCDSEEFTDLLKACYSKPESDVMKQSTDDDKETAEDRSAENNCLMTDFKEEDESDSETLGADSSVTQLTDAQRTIGQVLGEITADQPQDFTTRNNRCLLCRKRFSRFRDLKRHIQSVHHNERQHCCTQCQKSFKVEADLSRHIKHAHGDKMYKCDKCDYSSAYSNHLKTHISDIHLKAKPHKCPLCDSCFSQKCSLVKHIMSVHNQEKPYKCSACDKKFSRREHHAVHWRSVHSGEKPYSCDQCDYRCAQKSNLTHHQRTVHDRLKRFHCTQCEYKSSRMSDLTRHCIAVHDQVKSHSCTECGSAFSRASSLKTHVETVHSSCKPYSCTECNSNFSLNAPLQRHIKAVHRQEKPHSCSVCSKSFSDKYKLDRHLMGVHKQINHSMQS